MFNKVRRARRKELKLSVRIKGIKELRNVRIKELKLSVRIHNA